MNQYPHYLDSEEKMVLKAEQLLSIMIHWEAESDWLFYPLLHQLAKQHIISKLTPNLTPPHHKYY